MTSQQQQQHPLSFDKFNEFLTHHGYLAQKIYTLFGQCHFIEVLCQSTLDRLLLRVSRDLQFEIPYTSSPVIEMVPVKSEDGYIDDIEDYVAITDRVMEQSYQDVNIHVRVPTEHKGTMSEHLDDVYKRNILMEEMQGNDRVTTKDLVRQIRRLRFCIRGVTHKIALIHAPWITLLSADDKIIVLRASGLPRQTDRRLVVIVELRRFYDRVDIVGNECQQIFDGIYNILSTNQKTHIRNLQQMMETRDRVVKTSERIHQAREAYKQLIENHKQLIGEMLTHEQSTRYDLDNIRLQEPDTMHSEMRHTHRIQALERRLVKMEALKHTILEEAEQVRRIYDRLTLCVDTILFDNIVMLDKMNQNFEALYSLEASIRNK